MKIENHSNISGEIEIKPLMIITGDFRESFHDLFTYVNESRENGSAFTINLYFYNRTKLIDTPTDDNEFLRCACPEAFLHPNEIVDYAKRLIQSLKKQKNSSVLIGSFCPAMIECLLTIAGRENFDGNLSVSFAEKSDENTFYRDVTNDLEIIFSDLSYPIQKIYLEGLKLKR